MFRFIKKCGTNLTHLRLDCCGFVNDTTLIAINLFCKYIKGKAILTVIFVLKYTCNLWLFRIEFEKLHFNRF